jgi:4-amino-4-deoxy-L-arabinose transferase-like glycosyltransferase
MTQGTSPSGRLLDQAARLLLVGLLLAVVLAAAALDLLPPTERDALIHHLAVPKLWLAAGGMVEIPWLLYGYYPMNLELLYLLPLALGADWAAQLIHHGFALLTGLLLGLYLGRRLGPSWGLAGALFFLSTPLVFRLSTSANVDLGLGFFITAAWMALLVWSETRRPLFFLLSALALGLALGAKYNALLAAPLLAAAVFVLRLRAGAGLRSSLACTAAYTLAAALVFLPWMARSALWTGNPLYPLFNSLWGLESLGPPGLDRLSLLAHRHYLYGESLLEILLVPVRAFFSGQDDSPRHFDGVLGPALLLFSLVAVIRPRGREIRLLGLFALLYALFVFFQATFRSRYLMPILPVLVVLMTYGLFETRRALGRFLPGRPAALALVLLVALSLLPSGLYIVRFWQKAEPASFLSGREDRVAYLRRRLDYYPAVNYLNRTLPREARVLLLFAGDQGYYFDREYRFAAYFSGEGLRPLLERAADGEALYEGFAGRGLTYILTRDDLLAGYLAANFDRARLRVWTDFANKDLRLLYRGRGYSLYEISRAQERTP